MNEYLRAGVWFTLFCFVFAYVVLTLTGIHVPWQKIKWIKAILVIALIAISFDTILLMLWRLSFSSILPEGIILPISRYERFSLYLLVLWVQLLVSAPIVFAFPSIRNHLVRSQ